MTRTTRSGALRSTYGFIGIAMALGLAACESGGASTPASETQNSDTSTAAPAASDNSTQSSADSNRINIAKCDQAVGDKVFFQIGEAKLGVPGNVIVDAIPSSLKPPLKKEEVTRELQRQAASGAGCPERPLKAVLLVINDKFEHPLLEGTAGLVRASPNVTERFAELTRNLQAKPTQNCKNLNGNLLACVGTETRGNRDTPVMYVITTDKSQTLNTGGPLAARCILNDKKIQGCNLIDRLPGELTVDVTLNAGTYTTADLAGARSAALKRISSYAN